MSKMFGQVSAVAATLLIGDSTALANEPKGGAPDYSGISTMYYSLIGIVLATRYIEDVRAEDLGRFDLVGMALAGLGIAALAFGLSVAGLGLVPPAMVVSLAVSGVIFLAAYGVHARSTPAPALDLTLMRIPTFRANVSSSSGRSTNPQFRIASAALCAVVPMAAAGALIAK